MWLYHQFVTKNYAEMEKYPRNVWKASVGWPTNSPLTSWPDCAAGFINGTDCIDKKEDSEIIVT